MQVAPQQTQSSIPSGTYASEPNASPRQQYSPQIQAIGGHSQFQSKGTPNSSQRPSRQPSGNGAEPLQQQGYQPRAGLQSSSANASGGHDIATTTYSSPVAPATTSSPSFQPSRRDHRGQQHQQGGPPISPPPRTSSNQRGQNPGLPSNVPLTDRSVLPGQTPLAPNDRPNSSPSLKNQPPSGSRNKSPIDDQLSAEDQEAINDASAASAAANAARSRRRGRASPERPRRAASTKESGGYSSPSAVQSRSASHVTSGAPESRTPKDESQIISRVVVDDPAIDIKRAQERQLESVPALSVVNNVPSEDTAKTTPRSRQDYSASSGSASRRKETRFGEYILGQTLGEGEFGKVKLGWKKSGEVQVAIKLIRRETLNGNPARLPKIYREVTILRGLEHPNIVRLHEMIETPQFIGIILEYASGGELFDYILTHRYLKDGTARKLFAQLVSGVGYLHKKGIVHRDLKLENLLLDRNRNIVITDFGFANTFDPRDELDGDIEQNLTDRNFVKRRDLDRVQENGSRRGDLMATSCGSPCYAAPELVVTDSLYTGRKVDVWSCGVILYAMLAGYLPFDDDPANPEGDNINLLYKYITTTPLTFPEYVTPHARDLLRRILVPDPRQRADLFEVARHSWLSDYAHVVAQVTSSTTGVGQIATATVSTDQQEPPQLFRSASVREPAKTQPTSISPVGALSHQGKIDREQVSEKTKAPRDPKRRTVQVEYVAPQRQTARGEALPTITSPTAETPALAAPSSGQARTRARAGTEGPEIVSSQHTAGSSTSKPLPQDPSQSLKQGPVYQSSTSRAQQRPSSSQRDMAPPARPPKDFPRSASDSTTAFGQLAPSATTRPTTGGSMTSTVHGRLPSRGNSYSQPLAPTVAAMNAQGRLAQPKNGKQYNISAPMDQPEPYYQNESIGRPSTHQFEAPPMAVRETSRGHKRSNTLGNFFRTGSVSGGRSQPQSPGEPQREKKYPPTSMKVPIVSDSPRQSTDSRRPSFAFGRKNSDLRKETEIAKQEKPRRFSLLPASFSFKSFTSTGSSKDQAESRPASEWRPSSSVQQTSANRGQSRPQTMTYNRSQNTGNNLRAEEDISGGYDGQRDCNRDQTVEQGRRPDPTSRNAPTNQYTSQQYQSQSSLYPPPKPSQPGQSYLGTPTESEISLGPRRERPLYPQGFNSQEEEQSRTSMQQGRSRPGVLQKNNRKFADAYEQDSGGHHAGSSGAAKRVMEFFRRRGKARAGDERV